MTLGEKLLELRKEKGLSQEEVGNIIDVSRQTVSKWEMDQSIPELSKIVTLSDYYKISLDELLKGLKYENPNNNIVIHKLTGAPAFIFEVIKGAMIAVFITFVLMFMFLAIFGRYKDKYPEYNNSGDYEEIIENENL